RFGDCEDRAVYVSSGSFYAKWSALRDIEVNDFGGAELRLISQLRLLQLEPLLLGRALLQLRLERQEPIADRRIGVDVDLAPGRVDEPEPLRLDPPTLHVLAAQERLQEFR